MATLRSMPCGVAQGVQGLPSLARSSAKCATESGSEKVLGSFQGLRQAVSSRPTSLWMQGPQPRKRSLLVTRAVVSTDSKAKTVTKEWLPIVNTLPIWEKAGVTDTKSFSLEGAINRFSSSTQVWALKHPGVFSRVVLAVFYLIDALISGGAQALGKDPDQGQIWRTRVKHVGPNYASHGMLMVGDYEKVVDVVTRPQLRRNKVAWFNYEPRRCPVKTLLFLSDKEEGGDGSHEQLKAVVLSLLTSKETLGRAEDETSKEIIRKFAKRISEQASKKELFKFLNTETTAFVAAYVRHAVFDIPPTEQSDVLKKWDGLSAGYNLTRLWPVGPFIKGNMSDDEKAVLERFRTSTPIKNVDRTVGGPIPGPLEFDVFTEALMPAIFIAALPGVSNSIAFGLPFIPNEVKLRDLTPKGALNVMHECIRLHPPVKTIPGSTSVPIHVSIMGEKHTFPAGTDMGVNIYVANRDPTVFKDATKFDANRKDVRDKVLSFANHGGESHGRECPGQPLVEALWVQILMELGKLDYKVPA